MSIPRLLDHVVIAGPDLAALVGWFAERTGVTAAPGGVHPTGTANALVAFTTGGERGPRYVELIGPDPARDIVPTTFGIDGLDAPRIVTYAVHPDGIADVASAARAAGVPIAEVADYSRRTPDGDLLEWRLARAPERSGELPFLIDWGTTPQPGLGALPTLELVSFARVEPDPGPLRGRLAAYGLADGDLAEVVAGEPAGYRLVVRRPDGEQVEL